MPPARYKTAGAITIAAGRELGLGVVTDPYSSIDESWLQLTQMLNSIGRELLDTYVWENLVREYTFPTIGGQSSYDLPVDYFGMIDETGWDRTSQLPLRGPITASERQALLGSPLVTSLPLAFWLTANTIEFAPAASVPAAHTIAFEQRSLAWVRPAASGIGNGETLGVTGADECVVAGDYPLFDPLLLQYALKLWWKKDRGFDTTASEADFIRVLENSKGRAKGARVLYPAGGRADDALIGDRNLPWP